MAETTAKTAKVQGAQFKPGQSGNPAGRPAGSRNKATLALEALIDGQGEAVVQAMVEAALNGDVSAQRALLDRLVPIRRDRPVMLSLPALAAASDAPKAMAAIVAAAAAGDLTASEAADMAALVERFVKAIEASELAVRLSAIEKQLEHRK